MKDELYWNKRRKNNEAAKQSREAKRRKDNQIVMRAAFLEEKNTKLRDELGEISVVNDAIRNDVKALHKKVDQYQNKISPFHDPPQVHQHLHHQSMIDTSSPLQDELTNMYLNLL